MAPVESIVPTASLGYPYSLEKNNGLDGDNLGNVLFTKASPDFLTGPLVWSGADFKGNQAYTLQLSEEDVVEIGNALSHFKSQKHHETYTREKFCRTNAEQLLGWMVTKLLNTTSPFLLSPVALGPVPRPSTLAVVSALSEVSRCPSSLCRIVLWFSWASPATSLRKGVFRIARATCFVSRTLTRRLLLPRFMPSVPQPKD